MLRLFLILLFIRYAQGVNSSPDPFKNDAMLAVLIEHGATPASICPELGKEGCAGALWARYWMLVRNTCLNHVRVRHAPVLLYQGPQECRNLNDSYVPGRLEALMYFMHPGFAPYLDFEAGPTEPDPLDAAFVLLSTPAPPTKADNHTATSALLPQLNSWLRYVPAQIPWTLDATPRAPVARSRFLATPLRMLLSTIVLPVLALLAAFMLLLRWPQREPEEQPSEEKALVEDDVLCGEAA